MSALSRIPIVHPDVISLARTVSSSDAGGLLRVGSLGAIVPPASFSGCDIHVGLLVPEGKGKVESTFRKFGELQTLTLSSHRGVTPVRLLGEHWSRDHVRGTRTFAGTLIFSVLHSGVFQSLLRLDRKESYTPYTTIADQLPPFTITVVGVNEIGQQAAMAILDVVLVNNGITLSIDDIFTETSYNFVAKWATPWLDLRAQELVTNMTRQATDLVQRMSSYRSEKARESGQSSR